MKLIVEATVAGKSQVLADGLVRVHVIEIVPRQCAAAPDTGQCTGIATGRGMFAGLCQAHQPPPSHDPRDYSRDWPNGGQTVERTVGRLSLTAELWEWVRDWVQAAGDMGAIGAGMGAEIEIREREHSVESGKRADTMRGRLLEAAGEAAARAVGVDGGKGAGNAPVGQDEALETRKHAIGGLYRQVESHKKGK